MATPQKPGATGVTSKKGGQKLRPRRIAIVPWSRCANDSGVLEPRLRKG
nr:hypothetical protein [Pseudomonas chlororaphis]